MIAAVLGCAAVPAQATTVNYVMDFDTGGVCTSSFVTSTPDGTLTDCAFLTTNIGLTYGDQPGVDVEWRANADLGEQRLITAISTGNTFYADNFANARSNILSASIILRALDGATVGLQGFELVASNWLSTALGNNDSGFTINDLDPVNGFASVSDTVASTTVRDARNAFSFLNLSSAVGIEIRLGPDASSFGWGIDNIRYSVTPAGVTATAAMRTDPAARRGLDDDRGTWRDDRASPPRKA